MSTLVKNLLEDWDENSVFHGRWISTISFDTRKRDRKENAYNSTREGEVTVDKIRDLFDERMKEEYTKILSRTEGSNEIYSSTQKRKHKTFFDNIVRVMQNTSLYKNPFGLNLKGKSTYR